MLRNKLLYRDNNGELLLVIPKMRLQNSIISQAHEQGHFGVNRRKCLFEEIIGLKICDQKSKRF